MAKQHEKQSDLDREDRAIRVFCRWSKSEYIKLPVQYRADYIVFRGKTVVAVVEVKGRSAEFGKYDEVFIASHKCAEVLMYASVMNVPAYVVYTHPNGIYYLDMRKPITRSSMMQDSRNRDDRDFEPVVWWKRSDCECITKSGEFY